MGSFVRSPFLNPTRRLSLSLVAHADSLLNLSSPNSVVAGGKGTLPVLDSDKVVAEYQGENFGTVRPSLLSSRFCSSFLVADPLLFLSHSVLYIVSFCSPDRQHLPQGKERRVSFELFASKRTPSLSLSLPPTSSTVPYPFHFTPTFFFTTFLLRFHLLYPRRFDL